MKKILLLLLIISSLGVLTACQTGSKGDLVISKLFESTEQQNNAIELYNISDEDVDLKNYLLNFYNNGSLEISSSISLNGIVKANDYFVIGSSNATDETLKSHIDFAFSEGSMPFNGNDSVELVLKKTVIDYVGLVGSDVDYSKDLTLIRIGNKEEYSPSNIFDPFNFIYYLPDMFQYMKNETHEIKTLEDLLAGPRLEQRYLEMPYVDPSSSTIGGGGAVIVSLTGVADGDTAYFTANDGFPGGSVRYFYLNTPEVDGTHVSAEPWGYVASKYNKEYLLANSSEKEIHIQSMRGYALTEGYGRSLGLVWINGFLSQFLIVKEGLTESVGTIYASHDLEMHYKNVPYLTFLRFAEQFAIEQGWGIKGYPSNPDGEKSPDWNYESNTKTTQSPVWTPHLPLPWE
ncbi:MAG: lamin tail domain-containing protein [Acholeplasmataceae bacterium]|nr:lamin tail domain-containing protein [Acholeplasmataceae bacterium]